MRGQTRRPGVVGWLARREAGARRLPPALPTRAVPVERLLEGPHGAALRQCIILGFTSDGGHLLCYSHAARGRYALHVWRFRGAAPAEPLCTLPLFERDTGAEGNEEDDTAGLFGACGGECSASGARHTRGGARGDVCRRNQH